MLDIEYEIVFWLTEKDFNEGLSAYGNRLVSENEAIEVAKNLQETSGYYRVEVDEIVTENGEEQEPYEIFSIN